MGLEKEHQYYLDNKDQILADYEGRYIVIVDDQVLGDYDTQLDAINATQKTHELGTFLVQRVDRTDTTIHLRGSSLFRMNNQGEQS